MGQFFEKLPVPFPHRMVLRRLAQTVACGFVEYKIDITLTSSRYCGIGVREAFVINLNYFFMHIRELSKVLVLLEMNVRNAKFGDGNMKQETIVDIQDSLSSSSSMAFCCILKENYLY